MTDRLDAYTPVALAARRIGPPGTISPAARQVLSDAAALPRMAWPAASDTESWRERAATVDTMWQANGAPILAAAAVTVSDTMIAGVPCYDCVPHACLAENGPLYLFLHGGAFVVGAGAFAKVTGVLAAARMGVRTLSADYRLAPDDPFPAAPEDIVAVYSELIERIGPARIVIGGSSAGGNIAASAILMIRDRGLPLPAGAVLLTPEVDLTESGDSFRTNEMLDVVLKGALPAANALYADGHDLADPYVSPLFADFTRGFPATLVQSGTRDLFLSNSVLIHRRLRDAGVDAELHVWEAMPHGGFLFGEVPENLEIDAEVARFIRRVTA